MAILRLYGFGTGTYVYLALSSVSALASIWLVFDLIRRSEVTKQRIFWRQLLALALTNFISLIYGIVLTTVSGYIAPTLTYCQAYFYGRAYLEYSASFIEIMIAAGFCAASCHAVSTVAILKRSLPLAFVASLFLMPVGVHIDTIQLHSSGWGCVEQETVWNVLILTSCFFVLILYVAGWSFSTGAPAAVRRRLVLCGGVYLLAFLGTYGSQAIVNVVLNASGVPAMDHSTFPISGVVQGMLCLYGALNVCAYAIFTYRVLKTGSTGYSVQFGHTSIRSLRSDTRQSTRSSTRSDRSSTSGASGSLPSLDSSGAIPTHTLTESEPAGHFDLLEPDCCVPGELETTRVLSQRAR